MRIRGERPKLGALCRWVRDLDVVSGLSGRREGDRDRDREVKVGGERSARDTELLVVLDAILRVTGPVDVCMENTLSTTGPIALKNAWDPSPASHGKVRRLYEKVLDGEIHLCLPASFKDRFSVIETTPGPLRKPPNRHPAVLHASTPLINFLDTDIGGTTLQHHPIVPNLSVITNVLSDAECSRIIAAAESIGFLPDAPILEDGNEDSSVLAHNFYWLIDAETCSKLWDRVRRYVPKDVGGKKARGLNRRFRAYRYVPGAEYRCHIGKSTLTLFLDNH
jgi:hypothetical protein